MEIYINNKRIRVSMSDSIGKGGEADIFKVGNKALKVFKSPSHPDLTGNPHEQKVAIARIQEHQEKLWGGERKTRGGQNAGHQNKPAGARNRGCKGGETRALSVV